MGLKFFVFLLLLCSPTAWAVERIALVIGNGDYKEVSSLKNPINDAKDMAKTLRLLNFKVIEKHNVNRKQMAKAITQFGKKLGKGTVGLFYYAGHGLQVNGNNYLLPLNAPIATIDEVHFESIDVNRILAKMEATDNGLNIMILDTCRNNPFRGRGSFRSIRSGLAEVNAPKGSLIIYSTAPGTEASDGQGKNGLFTKYLLKNIVRPELDVALMLRDIRYQVMQEAERLGFEQVPWESSSLVTPFCFAGCETVTKPSVKPAQSEVENPPAVPVITSHSFEPEMVAITGGTFQIGCLGDDEDCINNEKPKTTVAPFAIGKYEVTFAEWDVCVKAKGCLHKPHDEGWGRNQRPVINVSWNDIQQYVQWLNKETGKSYRLPTEAEWEYVARVGTTTKYPWGNNITHENANYGADACCRGLAKGRDQWVNTAPVGKFAAYKGVHDMHGNVWEWTCSVYKKHYKEEENRCAKISDKDTGRVLRGGGWISIGRNTHSTIRKSNLPDSRNSFVGFRLALELSSSKQ